MLGALFMSNFVADISYFEFMETKDNWFDKLLMKKRFYIIITLLFVGVFAYIIKWQHILRFFDDEYVVNHELLGTYGDFIGGVLGTIFALISTLILIRTFNQQRAVTEKNKEQIENQRFNDLFFELLRSIVSYKIIICKYFYAAL